MIDFKPFPVTDIKQNFALFQMRRYECYIIFFKFISVSQTLIKKKIIKTNHYDKNARIIPVVRKLKFILRENSSVCLEGTDSHTTIVSWCLNTPNSAV